VAEERPEADGRETPTQSTTGAGPQESSTKGMLREAIQKVMEEISYHEQEARKHMQQAEALRKDLRESFAFLQEREGKGKPTGMPGEARPSRVVDEAPQGKAKEVAPTARQPRGSPKKQSAGRKSKGG
jgi:hypothetical protein